MRALIGIGIFRQRSDGRYALTPLAETLRTDAPVSMAGMARWVGSPQHREHWSRLTDAIRTGHPVIPELRGKPIFEYLTGEAELGAVFNSAMTNLSEFATVPLIAAYDFNAFDTIVDVGGGPAAVGGDPGDGSEFARRAVRSSEGRRGRPGVVSQVRVDDRVRIEEGSFFDSAPDGGDAYVLKNVIHDWPEEDAVRILKMSATRPHRRALSALRVRLPATTALPRKWVDIEMLVVAGARERTADEYGRLFDHAGFRLNRVVDTVSPLSIVEATAV